jgi:subtilisin family serine protease
MRKNWTRALAAGLTLVVAGAGIAGSTGAAAAAAPPDGTYLVSLRDSPLASYGGGLRGLPATKPSANGRLDAGSAAARSYRSHLDATQNGVLRAAGVRPDKAIYRYTAVNNAVALRLTGAEVARLRGTAGVVSVLPNETYTVDTVSTPGFLGLAGDNGVWRQQFGGDEHAGEGMIVGVIDTGIWPESQSFAALPEPRPDQAAIDAKWRGTCETGDDRRGDTGNVRCNNKVIGARWFGRGKPRTVLPDEFDSPRDYAGHGSHTSATAAGDGGVPVTIGGQAAGLAYGMAPAARIASYKALWAAPGGASGTLIDIVAAIEAAVLDGVDVINYSVSGVSYTTNYPVGMAFFNAAQAGVFVSAAAGNDGTVGPSLVQHNVPWVTTVAATTHDRAYRATLTLGDGTSRTGGGLGDAVAPAGLVDAAQAGRDGADPTKVRLCYDEDVLDPAKVAGRIVLCARGVVARTVKSVAVKKAGGAGMVLYNTDPAVDDIEWEFHAVPTVHVTVADGAAILAYAKQPGATAALGKGQRYAQRAPEVATFSSYGPANAGRGDLLKPDIAAPGVDVIAATAPAGNGGEEFATYSGTSMAAPHIAGIAALVMSKHPSWSPMAVKSALMTTAVPVDNTGAPIQRAGVAATPLHYGAGQVVPPRAFDPGLVYDSGPADWLAYMCALADLAPEACAGVPNTDPSDLNGPSLAIGDLVGTQTLVRTVTNTTSRAGVYRAVVVPPAGATVTVSPSTLVVLPGRSASFRVTVRRTSAQPGTFTFGSLVWSDGLGHQVRSPIAVRPVAVSVPPRVVGTGTAGSTVVTVKPGYTGTLQNSSTGIVPATVTPVDLSDPTGIPFDQNAPVENSHTKKLVFDIPTGTRLFALAFFDSEYEPGTNADYHIYRVTKDAAGRDVRTYLGGSVRPDSEEAVELYSPVAARYEVYVDLFALPGSLTSQTVRLYSWVLGAEAVPVDVSPASQGVRDGVAFPLTVTWNGLQPGTRYLGVLLNRDGTALIGRSVLRIDT